MNSQRLGYIILAFSLITVSLLLIFGVQLSQQQADSCEQACGAAGKESCSLNACPYQQAGNNFLFSGVIGLMTAFVGGVGSYLAFAKRERLSEQREYDLTGLDEQEKNTFILIKEKREGVYQSDLLVRLEVSKVKMTRILDKLEQNGLIERKRRGMTNLVVVKRN